jgi:hypothetical protein
MVTLCLSEILASTVETVRRKNPEHHHFYCRGNFKAHNFGFRFEERLWCLEHSLGLLPMFHRVECCQISILTFISNHMICLCHECGLLSQTVCTSPVTLLDSQFFKRSLSSIHGTHPRLVVADLVFSGSMDQSFFLFKKLILFIEVCGIRRLVSVHRSRRPVSVHRSRRLVFTGAEGQLVFRGAEGQLVFRSRRPISVHRSRRPLSVHRSRRLVSVHRSRRPISVHRSRRPINVHRSRRLVNVHRNWLCSLTLILANLISYPIYVRSIIVHDIRNFL